MRIREYPAEDDRPHIYAARFLEELGLKVRKKWHPWNDLFPWSWQVRGYKPNEHRGLFGKKWTLVLDIWPGEFESMGWFFNKGHIIVLDDDFEAQALELASQIEARFANRVTVTLYRK